ncbi:beta-CASP ribonuclease aCPSF1 [Natronorubrum bangense]|uniref:Transcription termination factor FttA n=2 Tax=Natronorubrum bangense TaxID=61858 RepID=L9WL83_9EURY|nr:beta-CASP ribonuclease aCPSF1 [Natronorubrum bangense]ELY49098.1 KH-domain/beta-lactamase-domain-containing protein [Natronorubrum bangense JCM 10635]QCC57007.1 beta-CASP ribonuclease aCPSF1 [Natronorubrum bangense]
MSDDTTHSDIYDRITSEAPSHLDVTEVQYEGPELVIYTETPREFAEDGDLLGDIARSLRKRVTIRPAPGTQSSPTEAETTIREIVPDDAQIQDLEFYPTIGEVLIEAKKPGLVIGRRGGTLREITQQVGWNAEVVRTPPIESSTVDNVRNFLTQERGERREFLKQVGEQIHGSPRKDVEWVRVTTLGCCREVGRASFVLHTPNTRVLIDCGDKPGAEGEVPYLHAPEAMPLTDIDAVVLTHAHLDHSALLPLLFKYGYNGPIYTTEPTRDLMGLLQLDYLSVASKEGRSPPYSSEQVRQAIMHTIPVEYGDVTDIAPDIKLTMHNAGHILGSASAHFHVGDGFHNVVFSGDVHYEPTRLFNGAVNDFPRAETMIMESTYGRRGDFQTDTAKSEANVHQIIHETYKKDGITVIPAFAVGRSQELMLVLEEAMREGDLPTMPVYLDGMIREATAIHTAYPEYLRDGLRQRILHEDENPFIAEQFRQVDGGQEMREEIASGEPCVILSTSGMVTGGPIMSWLELLGPNPNNTLLFVGYQAAGTLGRRIQSGHTEIPMEGRSGRANHLTLAFRIESVSGFSGHADRAGLKKYVKEMNPRPETILCVHGDEQATDQLSSALYQQYNVRTYSPKNLETFRFP